MKKWLAPLILFVLVAIDQVTKYFAKQFLEGTNGVPIIKDVLLLQYLEGGNTGAAFGIFSGKTQLLGAFSLVVFIVLVLVYYFLTKRSQQKFLPACILVLSAGALGNCIDRLARQYVVDFIYFKPIDFPVFNVADIYVTVAAVTMFILVAFAKETQEE
ncbi:MAG: signal peptidase II [Lachnospiraceae bacterium]|nr:signal peptidase II [Lachnospiraceae bacterium]